MASSLVRAEKTSRGMAPKAPGLRAKSTKYAATQMFPPSYNVLKLGRTRKEEKSK